MLKVNKEAMKIVSTLLENPELYGVTEKRLACGATIIDTGLQTNGSYQAGLMVTEIAMGGLGKATLTVANFGELTLPSIIVETSHPTVALFGCQLAGWRIKLEDFAADASGPGRTLSGKPGSVFRKIGYRDSSTESVLLLETKQPPDEKAATEIAKACNVSPPDLYLLLTTTTSLVGTVQISGRIVETGLFRLDFLGFDCGKVLSGIGSAPIMPPHPDHGVAMGRCEDALTYGGFAHFEVDHQSDPELQEYVWKAPSTNSKDYGKNSYQVYKAVNFDFTQIDPAIFAPAKLCITNKRTGTVFSKGEINSEVLSRALV